LRHVRARRTRRSRHDLPEVTAPRPPSLRGALADGVADAREFPLRVLFEFEF